jgi:hypothetical protein
MIFSNYLAVYPNRKPCIEDIWGHGVEKDIWKVSNWSMEENVITRSSIIVLFSSYY